MRPHAAARNGKLRRRAPARTRARAWSFPNRRQSESKCSIFALFKFCKFFSSLFSFAHFSIARLSKKNRNSRRRGGGGERDPPATAGRSCSSSPHGLDQRLRVFGAGALDDDGAEGEANSGGGRGGRCRCRRCDNSGGAAAGAPAPAPARRRLQPPPRVAGHGPQRQYRDPEALSARRMTRRKKRIRGRRRRRL